LENWSWEGREGTIALFEGCVRAEMRALTVTAFLFLGEKMVVIGVVNELILLKGFSGTSSM
jgi:hypothetical protein